MLRTRKILLLLGAGIACLLVALILRSGREPAYHHRSLSQWLKIARTTNLSREKAEEAADAIRHIGTNGLPLLLAWAISEPRNQGWKRRVLALPDSIVPKSLRIWAQTRGDVTRANEAKLGISILGPQGAPVIPQLTQLAITPVYDSTASWAAEALGDIGPAAFPALVQILTNSSSYNRFAVISALTRFGTNALPALIWSLGDTNKSISGAAASAIGRIGLEPALSVPVLTKCLRSPNGATRVGAALALTEFGGDARFALPELQAAASTETCPYVKSILTIAIRKLGGELPAIPTSP
jgi:hypothetical protein